MNKSLTAFIFCSIFLFASTFFTKRWNNEYNAVLNYDAAGYYMYLPSFFYDDLGKIHNKELIMQHHPFDGFDEIGGTFNQNFIIKYTCGIAILELPAFAVAHVWAKAAHYPLDGFSFPYQVCINFWSILFAILGLWMLRKILLRYFTDEAVAVTLITLCAASNLYNFISFSGNMSHSYLFTLYAAMLLLTDNFYKRPSFITTILLGLCAGMAVLIRPTEMICMIIITCWGLTSFEDLKKRFLFFKDHFLKIFVFAAAAFLIGSIQLLYWKTYTGHWLYWSYGPQEKFDFLQPHIFNGLLSYRKGWFVYTPVMILSVVGWWYLFKYFRSLFSPLFIFFILNIYFVFSWYNWWYGGSFSQRGVVQSYAVLAFPIAALFQISFRKKIARYILFAFIIFCTWLNFVMTYQAYSVKGIMESNSMSRKYYWKIFGRLNINASDRKYIDVKDELPHRLEKKLSRIYFNDFEKEDFADTCQAFSGVKGLVLSKTKQETQEIIIPVSANQKGYYRVSVKVWTYAMEWDVWKQAQFIVSLNDSDHNIKTNLYRIYRIIEPGAWQEIYMDIRTPEKKTFNTLKMKFWNAGGEKQLQLDDLSVQFAAD
ncbi:MAG: hypothetical protein JWN78_2209 [Bacteroidota bacterium]|nr:hypothetical protein [Bacteroidota bacterium]